jgi:spore coat protein H
MFSAKFGFKQNDILQRRRLGLILGLLFAVVLLASFATKGTAKKLSGSNKQDASDAFFSQGQIPELKFFIEPPELDKLRQDPRNYVRGKMVENGTKEYLSVGIKLKGAAGSFRDVNDRPALTINSDKYKDSQKFHDIKKFHLNNSVQDESLLNEAVCSALFNQAGVAATRVSHARVWLNDRDLGIYVLKEGFDKRFLGRYFASTDGNFYDGGFIQDIDKPLEKDFGDGLDDRSDLKALLEACREPNETKRQELLAKVLDVDNFLTFMAMELITCHWDGYIRNVNNYRLYFEPSTKLAYFIPHGMDQMFGNPGEGVFDIPPAQVAQAVLRCSLYRQQYDKKVRELGKMLASVDAVHMQIDNLEKRLQPVLMAMNGDRARQQLQQAESLKQRIAERSKNLLLQIQSRPQPMEFDALGQFALQDWAPQIETQDAQVTEAAGPGGIPCYKIQCGPSGQCVASWRKKLAIPSGKYQFQAKVFAEGIVANDDGANRGGGIRVSGGTRTNSVQGTANWQLVVHPLELAGDQELTLVLELRAKAGTIYFAKDGLQLKRL